MKYMTAERELGDLRREKEEQQERYEHGVSNKARYRGVSFSTGQDGMLCYDHLSYENFLIRR